MIRRFVTGALLLVVAAVAWTAWQTFQVRGDLADAQVAARQLRSSITGDDVAQRREALGDLRVAATDAREHSDGWWFGLLSHLPVVGDDVDGIRALSSSLDAVSSKGVQPLADSVENLDGLTAGDGIDLDAVAALQAPLAQSSAAFDEAVGEVAGLDSSGYAGFLRTRFDEYVDTVTAVDRGVARAARASEVLPTLLGADGPRSYLLVLQNNAEIRATGGLPGSWSRIDADGGRLTIAGQGSGGDFGRVEQPVLPLTAEEQAVYSDLLGTWFLDANFTPDFPRAADLMRARWEQEFGSGTLDGVLTLDPVALSYLLRGTGPVRVGGVTLTADNAVEELLSNAYTRLPTNAEQDAFFAKASQAVFDAASGELRSPFAFAQGLARATDEGRFHLASFDDAVTSRLSAQVRGALSRDDGSNPHVEIGLNDATGSKMSYYLRYDARIRATSCTNGVQVLNGTMPISQSIMGGEAANLPDYVTGRAEESGVAVGSQIVTVRLYGPTGGTIDSVSIDGTDQPIVAQLLDGRPVVTALIQVSGPDDVVLSWAMTTGAGQDGGGSTSITPGVVGGGKDSSFASAC